MAYNELFKKFRGKAIPKNKHFLSFFELRHSLCAGMTDWGLFTIALKLTHYRNSFNLYSWK